MNNGALYTAILSPDPEVKYFDETTNFEYYSGEYTPSGRGFHAVAIVGWDDNYSKDNFTIGEKPKKDGAYLALNSWSANWGNGGYFYISYEDYYVENISNLARALNINVHINSNTDDIFQAVIDLEHEIDLELEKYYKSIDEELSLMMDLLKESDLPDTMPNEVAKILDLEDYRFGINQKLDKI